MKSRGVYVLHSRFSGKRGAIGKPLVAVRDASILVIGSIGIVRCIIETLNKTQSRQMVISFINVHWIQYGIRIVHHF